MFEWVSETNDQCLPWVSETNDDCLPVDSHGDAEGRPALRARMQHARGGQGDGAAGRAGLRPAGRNVRPRLAGDAQPRNHEGEQLSGI